MASQTLYVSVKGDTKDLIRALKDAEQRSTRSGKAMSKGIGAATKAMAALTAAAAAYLGIGLVRETIRIADTYSLLESRLKLVTSGTKELKDVQAALLGIANESRVSYEATANLYARLGRSTEHLGTSTEDLLKVTQTISKAMIVSGATTMEAQNAMIQLSQGLASNTLRGDELRSVLENIPRVARAIAEGMGITIGQLREFGQEGKLTAEVVIPALISQLDKIEAQFGQIDVTVSQATTVLKNVFFDIIDGANDASGGTDQLAGSILDLARVVGDNKEEIISLFAGMVEGISRVVQTTGALVNSFKGMNAVAEGTLTFFEYATSDADELNQKLREIAESGGTAESFRNRLGEIRSELKWLNEQMGKAGPENAAKYQGEINKLNSEMKNILVTLDGMVMGYEEVAEETSRTVTAVESSGVAIVAATEDITDKQLKAYQRSAKGIVDSWQLMYQDRYDIQSRALDAEIQAQEQAADDIDAILRDFYSGIDQLASESSENQKFYVDDFATSAEGTLDGFFNDTLQGNFNSASEAWDSLWKGMLSTVTSTVADMAAEFVIEGIIDNFFHKGAWRAGDRLGPGEHPAIVEADEMIIPASQSRQLREAMGGANLHGFDALVRAVNRGTGEGSSPSLTQDGAFDIGISPGLTSPDTRSSGYGDVFGFGGGLIGRAAVAHSPLAGVPGVSTVGAAVGKHYGGYLGERFGDWVDDRGYEGLQDAYEDGIIGGYEAHQFEQADKLAGIGHGSKANAIRDAYREVEQKTKDLANKAIKTLSPFGESSRSTSFSNYGLPSGYGLGQEGIGEGIGGDVGGRRGSGDEGTSSPGGVGGYSMGGIVDKLYIPRGDDGFGGLKFGERVLTDDQNRELMAVLKSLRGGNKAKIEVWIQGSELIPTQRLNAQIRTVSEDVLVERNTSDLNPTQRVFS